MDVLIVNISLQSFKNIYRLHFYNVLLKQEYIIITLCVLIII